MATVNLHTGILTSPKFVPLSDGAYRLWCHGLMWSKEHLTDGFIPTGMLPSLHRQAGKLVAELLQSTVPGKEPLWRTEDAGYRIHDFADWQDLSVAVQNRRRKWRDQKRGVTRTSMPDSTAESVAESTQDSNVESQAGGGSGGGSGLGVGGGSGEREQILRASSLAAMTTDWGPSPARRNNAAMAWQGRREGLGVPHKLHADLLSRMATPDDAALRAWYALTERQFEGRAVGDTCWQFWNARFAEWQGLTPRAALPAPAAPAIDDAAMQRVAAAVFGKGRAS